MTSTADTTELVAVVEDRLRDVAQTVRRSMLDAMPDGEPVQWLYGPMREYPSRPGKAALCLAAGRAFGGHPDDLLGIAVAIELLHNAFLVHDDIADGSEMRGEIMKPRATCRYFNLSSSGAKNGGPTPNPKCGRIVAPRAPQ